MNNCIASIRKSKRMSQSVLAEKAKINRVYLSQVERGKAEPGGQILIRIAKALDKRVEDIFFV
ncbi:MAG: helix-turn-helix transcriptional regulator [Sporomusaceae bacterium]|nr:helix-turn-helix transcriptional regulator [Sporomusaceae bacterium]